MSIIPKIQLFVNKQVPIKDSTEYLLEKAGGWKPAGMKAIFDRALFKKDAAIVRKLLSKVPEAYKLRFAKEINQALAIKAAPLIGAGALTVGAWAYPAWKLGEELGWRLEEHKAKKRLRPPSIPFREYKKYLPLIGTLQSQQENYNENKESTIPFVKNLKQPLFINK